jgi:AcrR family transcriptional regulator
MEHRQGHARTRAVSHAGSPPAKLPAGAISRLGQREKNKIDKLWRIKEAARELFITKGFDDTTTREIALNAGVGIGTVFIYADNKRDLLFLVANDELEDTTGRAEASVREDASLLQNLLTIFRHHYEFFARQPELSRLMLREMIFYDAGRQALRFQTTRERVIRLVGKVVDMAVDGRTIRADEQPDFIGWVAFCIYQVELRRWLASKDLDLNKGLAELERALTLLAKGLDPTERALAISRAALKPLLRKPRNRPGRMK